MNTKAALLDIHTRTHQSLQKFLGHLEGFSEDELKREFEGFGVGCILAQLDHIIGAEEYWLWVAAEKELPPYEDTPPLPFAELQAKAKSVAQSTRDYIESTSVAELNARRERTVFLGNRVALIPAQIVMRTQTHLFQHFGQISAICRLLGKPIPDGFDFPLRGDAE